MAGLSGFACLVYQILWMRQAGLMLGNTSHAAALTLAVFFGGLSWGGLHWGGRCRKHSAPLRTYAWLELGIALAGIAVLTTPIIIHRVYPMFDGQGLALTMFKTVWILLMVFPAGFFMGGTLPVLGQAVIRNRQTFGTTTAKMYAVNTLGAACGAFATAFVLIWLLGLRMTCITAMAVSATAALIAFRLARQDRFQGVSADALEATHSGKPQKSAFKPTLPRPLIVAFAFLSGFNLLALEVVWTRMLAQVHENSVYSFATVLIIVLVCLSLGAWIASRLAGSGMPAPRVLIWLLALGGAALAVTPLITMSLTRDLRMLDTNFPFADYVMRLFATGFAAIAPACLLLGAVFPFLMKGEETFAIHAGKSIGTLSAINTLGAILGSLAAGFLLLEWFGIWHTIQLLAAIYLLAAILMPAGGFPAKIVSCAMLLLLFTGLDPSKFSTPAGTASTGEPETLVRKWEGGDCTVSVVRNPRDQLSIKINSNYSLGSTEAYGPQIFQARIPLFAFPATDSVFFLGMGTGITAGEALNTTDFPDVRKVVASELSPNVVAASRKYFADSPGGIDLTNGLYTDPRATVVIGDGRNHLLASRETYSMINADLFLPYRRGTGSLYSREHFQIVRERLEPGGVFVQWLPLYQISEKEFGIIANTMLAVFPQVSLWRGNFQPGAEIAALVGHADPTPLPASTLDATADKQLAVEGASHLDMQQLMLPINPETVLLFYGGNLTRAADLFQHYPLNTDDKPVIEFSTPRSLHQPKGADRPHFLETRFASLVDKLQARTPPEQDPLLVSRSPASKKLPLAGSAFHRGWIARANGNEETWMTEWETFLTHWIPSEADTDDP
jgi:spermidine synthase